MNGNNSQSKEGFIASLSHPRKKELATMLFEGSTMLAMHKRGFNDLLVKEMSRDIRSNVEGMQTFTVESPVEGSGKTDDSTTTNTNEDTTTTEGTDQTDQSTAGESEVESEVQTDTNSTEDVAQSESDQTDTGTVTEETKA